MLTIKSALPKQNDVFSLSQKCSQYTVKNNVIKIYNSVLLKVKYIIWLIKILIEESFGVIEFKTLHQGVQSPSSIKFSWNIHQNSQNASSTDVSKVVCPKSELIFPFNTAESLTVLRKSNFLKALCSTNLFSKPNPKKIID